MVVSASRGSAGRVIHALASTSYSSAQASSGGPSSSLRRYSSIRTPTVADLRPARTALRSSTSRGAAFPAPAPSAFPFQRTPRRPASTSAPGSLGTPEGEGEGRLAGEWSADSRRVVEKYIIYALSRFGSGPGNGPERSPGNIGR